MENRLRGFLGISELKHHRIKESPAVCAWWWVPEKLTGLVLGEKVQADEQGTCLPPWHPACTGISSSHHSLRASLWKARLLIYPGCCDLSILGLGLPRFPCCSSGAIFLIVTLSPLCSTSLLCVSVTCILLLPLCGCSQSVSRMLYSMAKCSKPRQPGSTVTHGVHLRQVTCSFGM